MVALRGSREEYDSYGRVGAQGWQWRDLLPFFKRSENFTAPKAQFAQTANISWIENVHGKGGPVHVSYPNFFYNASANWWNAALDSGIAPTPDPNPACKTIILFEISLVSHLYLHTQSCLPMRSFSRLPGSRRSL
ncbi:hypothetical protein F5Y17DRAFT_202094 [Xylariaceae sp. FL0594]|nr:hypothetical protein F5Y17DRAFT_202094 [Xylariaceae sp. FL0594]